VSHEYDDPITPLTIAMAVGASLRLQARRPAIPLDEASKDAVDEVFCSCVTRAADASIGHASPVHEDLNAEIARLARAAIAERVIRGDEPVDPTSEHSSASSGPLGRI